MKVLLIGAGRRVSLAQRFIAHGFDIYAYETEINCPIASIGTVIEGKKWSDPNIRQDIVDTIDQIKPNLVLPLSDPASPILSSISYKGVVTASGRTNAICLDKQNFEKKLQSRPYYPSVEKDKPVIMKPIFGANSKGIMKTSYERWMAIKDHQATHIAQRLVDGFEISVDAYFNKYSKMIDAVPRQRVEVQGGEVSRSVTLSRDAHGVVEITKMVGEEIGLSGPICAQYIVGDGQSFIMEINARFGGGVILSMEAGFDQIQLLKEEWVENKICLPQQHDWQVGLSMTRYFQEYFYGGIDG